MKVAMVGRYPLSKDHIVGGVEAAIVYLSEELRRNPGLHLHILTLRPETRRPKTVIEDGLTVHYLPAARRLGHVTHHFLDRRRLVKELRRIGPDLVHAHIAGEYAEAAHESGYPYVLTLHGIRYREVRLWKKGMVTGVRASLISRWERACVRKARHIISISPYVTQEFGDSLRGAVYDVENPVRPAYFELPGPARAGRLLFVGSVNSQKGFLDLLQALRLVGRAELHVAGSLDSAPDFSSKLHELLKDEDLAKRVTFLGSLDERRLVKEYQEASIFVLPSHQETASMALLQAMAVGRPAVVTAVGGLPHLVEHGRTGLLVEPRDHHGLAGALSQLLDDTEAQREMGENARREALDRFHVSRIADRTTEVYQKVLGASGPRGWDLG